MEVVAADFKKKGVKFFKETRSFVLVSLLGLEAAKEAIALLVHSSNSVILKNFRKRNNFEILNEHERKEYFEKSLEIRRLPTHDIKGRKMVKEIHRLYSDNRMLIDMLARFEPNDNWNFYYFGIEGDLLMQTSSIAGLWEPLIVLPSFIFSAFPKKEVNVKLVNTKAREREKAQFIRMQKNNKNMENDFKSLVEQKIMLEQQADNFNQQNQQQINDNAELYDQNIKLKDKIIELTQINDSVILKKGLLQKDLEEFKLLHPNCEAALASKTQEITRLILNVVELRTLIDRKTQELTQSDNLIHQKNAALQDLNLEHNVVKRSFAKYEADYKISKFEKEAREKAEHRVDALDSELKILKDRMAKESQSIIEKEIGITKREAEVAKRESELCQREIMILKSLEREQREKEENSVQEEEKKEDVEVKIEEEEKERSPQLQLRRRFLPIPLEEGETMEIDNEEKIRNKFLADCEDDLEERNYEAPKIPRKSECNTNKRKQTNIYYYHWFCKSGDNCPIRRTIWFNKPRNAKENWEKRTRILYFTVRRQHNH